MKKSYLNISLFIAMSLCFALVSVSSSAQENKPASGSIDHSLFDSLLQRHVNEGRVSYTGFARDITVLNQYLTQLATTDINSYGREEQLAFYINAYNAFTIKLIVNNIGKIKSIRDINKPWDTKEWKVAGNVLSLNDIEHEILRKKFKEPRIHFAIVCASIGCPDLANRVFAGENIDVALTAATRRFFSSPKHLQVAGNTVKLSKIFEWFGDDFKQGSGSILDFVARYSPTTVAAQLTATGKNVRIKYLDYDWNLNGK